MKGMRQICDILDLHYSDRIKDMIDVDLLSVDSGKIGSLS